MMSSKRMYLRFPLNGQPILGVALALAAVTGGCSADVSRFDFPSSVSLNESSGTTGALPAPTPTAPVRERSNLIGNEGAAVADAGERSNGSAYYPAQPNRDNLVRMSALPETPAPALPASAPQASYSAPLAAAPASGPTPTGFDRRPPISAYGESAALSKGEAIEIRPGDTLYGLSKRHHVSVSELMVVNDLKGPNLKPGQKLHLPAAKPTREAALRPTDLRTTTDARPAAEARTPDVAPVTTSEAPPTDWTGTYVVKNGDSLYAIARQHKIKFTDLQKYNAIQDVRKVKPGTALRMPSGINSPGATTAAADPAPVQIEPQAQAQATAPVSDPAAPRVVQSSSQPTILNSGAGRNPAEASEKKVMALNQPSSATDAPSPSAGTQGSVTPGSGSVAENAKLRWPAQGKVIAGFGQRPDGTHNDGVNLAVPMGTDVHAAESGVVAYAGSELKGYGNLVLLRHDNGWVTAYAHSDELKVKRGDKVKRGQVIAKAGKTGQVDQPQVHFELRQGQRPVDPTPFMEKL